MQQRLGFRSSVACGREERDWEYCIGEKDQQAAAHCNQRQEKAKMHSI